jgi:hypothetical protein
VFKKKYRYVQNGLILWLRETLISASMSHSASPTLSLSVRALQ